QENKEEFDKVNNEILEIINNYNNLLDELKVKHEEFENDIKQLNNIKLDGEGFYDEIDVNTYRSVKYETTYYLIKIPKYDSNGDRIILKQGLAHDRFSSIGSETVREFSKRKGATIVSNLSPSTTQSRIIHKGKILSNQQSSDSYRETLAFNDDGDMRSYPNNVSSQTILNDGYTEAMTTFTNIIVNGSIRKVEYSDYLEQVHPRTVVGQDINGNTYILVSDGRRIGERGFKIDEVSEVMLSHGMVFAQMLDGGGSTQATIYHSNINKLSDSVGNREDGYIIGQNERSRSNFLYVGKDRKNDLLNKILSTIGNIHKNIDDRLSDYEN